MRARLAAVVALVVGLAGAASAEPAAAPGWRLDTLTVPGAIFAGLADDGDALLVTDLATGRLLRQGADGAPVSFGPAFPHGLDVIGDPTGPYRVARAGGRLIVAQGWTPVDADPGPFDHALVVLDEAGAPRVLNDRFWNPFDFVADGGTLYVVDAAANTIERIGADGSGQETVVTFRRLVHAASELGTLSPTEFAEGEAYEIDAVPTGIALHAGRIYVSLFGGFPFLAGAGRVVSLPVGGDTLTVEAGDLNAPVALAFDRAGRLLVLEHGLYDQAAGFRAGTGRLIAIDMETGGRSVVIDGLTRPASVLVRDDVEVVVSDLTGNLHFLTRNGDDQ